MRVPNTAHTYENGNGRERVLSLCSFHWFIGRLDLLISLFPDPFLVNLDLLIQKRFPDAFLALVVSKVSFGASSISCQCTPHDVYRNIEGLAPVYPLVFSIFW